MDLNNNVNVKNVYYTEKMTDAWVPPNATVITKVAKKRNETNINMTAPLHHRSSSGAVVTGKDKSHRSHHRWVLPFWIQMLWLSILTALTLWTFIRYAPVNHVHVRDVNDTTSKKLSEMPPAPNIGRHNIKVYPFNIYSTADMPMRYPAGDGGIPELQWQDVRYFKTCCKNDRAFRCFPTESVALRRDNKRTRRGLPDVYLEISNQSIATVGARCQLTWSVEQADVET